jgi:hypothetical protein
MRRIASCTTAMVAVAVVAAAAAVQAADTLVPPPEGAPLLLEVAADGVQIYVCQAKGDGYEWAFKAPEANLFDKQGLQIGVHFAGPTWKTDDGALTGEVMSRADAPTSGAVPWLLLKAKSSEGTGVVATAAFIRRADTKGGVAPTAGCDAAHKGVQARMRYSALYQFYGAPK